MINEGRNDKYNQKAIFVIGGPGSGKSTINKSLKSSFGLQIVDFDIYYEFLSKKSNKELNYEKDERLFKSLSMREKRLLHIAQEQLGVIIDGTGRRFQKIRETWQLLKSHDYDCFLIFVETDLGTSQDRNYMRSRVLNPEVVYTLTKATMDNKNHLIKLFGSNNTLIVDNSEDYADIAPVWKEVKRFLNERK